MSMSNNSPTFSNFAAYMLSLFLKTTVKTFQTKMFKMWGGKASLKNKRVFIIGTWGRGGIPYHPDKPSYTRVTPLLHPHYTLLHPSLYPIMTKATIHFFSLTQQPSNLFINLINGF